MALRVLARKLRIPATAALQQAPSHRVSSAMGSLASRPSQGGEGNRAVNGVKKTRLTVKELEKRSKKSARDYKRVVRLINNLPRKIAMSAARRIIIGATVLAYAFGAGGSRK